MMKNNLYKKAAYLFALAFAFLFSAGQVSAQEVLIDLDYNPALFSKKNSASEKSIMNNQVYFILDTLTLPFIDDFSTNKLKRYYNWEYPTPVDSMAIRFTLNGDTLPSVAVSEDTTWHYFYVTDSALTDTLSIDIANAELDTAIMLTSFEVVFYNGYNPFVPNDTIEYWPTEELYTFSDSDGGPLDNITVTVDFITLQNADDTVLVYAADTGTLWIDNTVFINSTYPIYPPSVGVATLDGVNENGLPYQFTIDLPYGVADHLTSKPVNLSPYEPSDSLYFSFYYQAQGRGNAPEQTDSLILQFRAAATDWKNIWFAEGTSLPSDSLFTQVMIPVKDTTWFENDFQFRFVNYATLSGNVDHWHIDYIRFNNGRTYEDTVYEDVAYVYPAYSLLQNFQSMPWSHFLVDPDYFMNDTLLLTFHNNLDAVKNTGYEWKVYNEVNAELFQKNGGSKNFSDLVFCENIGTQCDDTDPLPMVPDFTFTFPNNGYDSAEFEVVASLATNPDNIKLNDTLHYTQVFHNYYAYDDGTAENGYGLEVQGQTGTSMAAYRFNLIKSDTLRGVRFYFNPQLEDVSEKLFSLVVWTGTDAPETVIYEEDSLSPVYTPELNGFKTFNINDTDLVISAGTFFVGWKQLVNYRINIGFDRNINANENMFFNVLGGGWLQSQLPGAWMMRPVFSSDTLPPDVFSVEEHTVMSDFMVFPNPAADEVFIVPSDESGSSNDYVLNIFGHTGSLMKQVSYLPRSVTVSDLAAGFYFITIQHKETQEQKTYKLVISR